MNPRKIFSPIFWPQFALVKSVDNFKLSYFGCKARQHFCTAIICTHAHLSSQSISLSRDAFLSPNRTNPREEQSFPKKYFQIGKCGKQWILAWQSGRQVSPTSQLAFRSSLVRFLHIWMSHIVVDGYPVWHLIWSLIIVTFLQIDFLPEWHTHLDRYSIVVRMS